MINLAITGAAGRMGQRLVALAQQDGAFTLVAATERPGHPLLGRDAGEIAGVGPLGAPLSTELGGAPAVLIDFTAPAPMRQSIAACADRGIAMIIGTTGLQPSDHALIDEAARRIPILHATNMSLGVAVLNRIAAEVARMLGDDYDIEILEAHHRFKKDAPSGTAMTLADAILTATNKTRAALTFDRHGDDVVRQRGQIGMHSLRIGDEIGRHTAHFAALGERLELTHVATNRDTFVHGALRAAKWIAARPPGRYSILDVLGLTNPPQDGSTF